MTGNNQNAVSNLRLLFGMAHQYLEGTVAGLTDDQLNWVPGDRLAPIAAQYAHIVTSEDWLINIKAKNGAPVMASTDTGLSSPPPPVLWNEWARTSTINLPTVQSYAQAVYQATDAYLASITDDELNRIVDMSEVGMGQLPMAAVIGLALLNVALHCGETSCLKGLQGLVGYPEVQAQSEAV